jgi:hypothetical protein
VIAPAVIGAKLPVGTTALHNSARAASK